MAHLSRLKLKSSEATEAAKKLNGILDHFSAIQNIPTQGVEVADTTQGLRNVASADVVDLEVLCTTDELLERAPALRGKHVQVKAVFE